jgi:hypothetical protein
MIGGMGRFLAGWPGGRVMPKIQCGRYEEAAKPWTCGLWHDGRLSFVVTDKPAGRADFGLAHEGGEQHDR